MFVILKLGIYFIPHVYKTDPARTSTGARNRGARTHRVCAEPHSTSRGEGRHAVKADAGRRVYCWWIVFIFPVAYFSWQSTIMRAMSGGQKGSPTKGYSSPHLGGGGGHARLSARIPNLGDVKLRSLKQSAFLSPKTSSYCTPFDGRKL